MKILRVFPSITSATPNDTLCRFDVPGFLDPPDVDEIHISVTFTWDIPRAKDLYREWEQVHPVVKIGGPALDDPGGDFVSGRYLKPGFVMTSRGCINHCSYCMAQKREGMIRELPIVDGFNVVDNNILATSREHFTAVIKMLKRQPESPVFTGGLEARLLTDWHAQMLRSVMPKTLYFANDRPGDIQLLDSAKRKLIDAGFTNNHLYAYVLVGYGNDTISKAEKRLIETFNLGYTPYAMLFMDDLGRKRDYEWRIFATSWKNSVVARSRMKIYNSTGRLPLYTTPTEERKRSIMNLSGNLFEELTNEIRE